MQIEAGTNPFTLFDSWYKEAVEAEINDPDAIALASVNADGMPSVRMVLLRQWSGEGFFFFTNYESRKAGELVATGKAAFCLHWKSLRRQIRVTGEVSKASAERSDAYFASRGRGSRIGAWASEQSRPLESREALATAVAEVEQRFPDDVPRPPHWSGFRIRPLAIEFWRDRPFRLHDRMTFSRPDSASPWQVDRLYP